MSRDKGPGGSGGSSGSGGPGGRTLKQRVRTARRRSASSTRWIERQLNDPYVQRARAEGYRSRAAYKLIEIDDRFHLLKGARRLVDLGAAPGGWSQVASRRMKSGPDRTIVAVDLLAVDPIEGVTIFQRDLTDPETETLIRDALGGPADGVVSDIAPSTTGHRATDHLRIMGLAEVAHDIAARLLAPGGFFLAKVFQGGSEGELLRALKRDFASVRHLKPAASRSESVELYVLATGFRGVSRPQQPDSPDS